MGEADRSHLLRAGEASSTLRIWLQAILRLPVLNASSSQDNNTAGVLVSRDTNMKNSGPINHIPSTAAME